MRCPGELTVKEPANKLDRWYKWQNTIFKEGGVKM
jgi:hypothetical protein